MLFQQLIYQQGFFALRSNNAEMDKKARRSRLTQYLLQQKSFPFKKKTEIVLRVTKTAKRCSIGIFLVVASWSRTHFESFPHYDIS